MTDLTDLYSKQRSARIALFRAGEARNAALHEWSARGGHSAPAEVLEQFKRADRAFQEAARELRKTEMQIHAGLLRNGGSHGAADEVERSLEQRS